MHELLVCAAAMIAGGINSVAGGGSLVSFPTLIWLGVPSIAANATNTVAIWPGTLGSAWGYRRELRGADPRVYALLVPSVIGGIIGAVLLYRTPTVVFDRLVPVLILFATCLFMVQEPLQRRFDLAAAHPPSPLRGYGAAGPRTVAPSHVVRAGSGAMRYDASSSSSAS